MTPLNTALAVVVASMLAVTAAAWVYELAQRRARREVGLWVSH